MTAAVACHADVRRRFTITHNPKEVHVSSESREERIRRNQYTEAELADYAASQTCPGCEAQDVHVTPVPIPGGGQPMFILGRHQCRSCGGSWIAERK